MFKYIFLLLAVIISLLLPHYFTTVKELQKELVEKNQRIIELLDEKVGAQKDYERKIEKLEAEINFLKGQVSDKDNEFAVYQEQLDDHRAHSHISNEKSNDRLFHIIVCGMIVLLLVYYISTTKRHKCECTMQIQQHQKAITANESKSKRNDFVLHISINF